jgi:hypothetical protein
MKKRTAIEVSMMMAAQQMVDRWLRSPGRGPFNRAVARELLDHWNDPQITDVHRRAFSRIANAIRVGQGHAIANPAPLMRMARQLLRDTIRQDNGSAVESTEVQRRPLRNPLSLRSSR